MQNSRCVISWFTGALAAAVIAACASQHSAPDPDKLTAAVAAAKAEEMDLVRSTVGESARAERFIGLLSERDRLLNRYREEITSHREQMALLNADYRTERSELEALLADFNSRRRAAQAELLDLIAEMKQTTTEREWRTISAFQADLLEPRSLAYGGLPGGDSR